MAIMRDRASGIMDYIGQLGADLLTPPQASPVMPTATSPMQMAMNRPEVQFSQPSASTMVTTDPRSTYMAMASPTPQIQAEMTGAGVTGPRMNPPQVVPARPQMPDMGGAGVRMTQDMMAEQAAKAADLENRRPELKTDPTFQSRIKDFFGDRERMLGLALAFNSMRLQPDAGLAASISDQLKDLRATSQAQTQRNRTADALEQFDPKLAQAVRDGMDPKAALEIYQSQRKGVVVGKKIVNPYTAEVIYDGTGEGGDVPEALKTLMGRAKAAGLVPGSDEYRQFMLNGGQRSGLSLKVGADGTVELTEGGTTSATKLTDSQSNALAFGGRMQASNQILNTTEMQGTQLAQSLAEQVPIAGNYLVSPEFQQYSQAKRNFINAVLRKESGAAIAASEFENADKQYFPQPGDSPEVIKQKRDNRELATKLMMAGVPIQGLTEDPKSVLQNISGTIQKPATVPQNIWDAMTEVEKLEFK